MLDELKIACQRLGPDPGAHEFCEINFIDNNAPLSSPMLAPGSPHSYASQGLEANALAEGRGPPNEPCRRPPSCTCVLMPASGSDW